MKIFIFILTSVSVFCFAQNKTPDGPKLSAAWKKNIQVQCEKMAKKESNPEGQKKFCDCYMKHMEKLDDTKAALLVDFLNKKITTEEFEKKNYALAEFSFQAEDDCSETPTHNKK